jgi:hypothetical protein
MIDRRRNTTGRHWLVSDERHDVPIVALDAEGPEQGIEAAATGRWSEISAGPPESTHWRNAAIPRP